MNILTIENCSFSHSTKTLLENITLGIDDRDKIGVIGINGRGKSTLLNLIGGVLNPQVGNVIKGKMVTISHLKQRPDFNSEMTILENILEGDSELIRTIREYNQTLDLLEKDGYKEEDSKKLDFLNAKMSSLNAWEFEAELKTILNKLGIKELNLKAGKLSGGQRKRVALAQALLKKSDLLILDEPTNHLDYDTITWLEDYLKNWKGALIMVTHDRYFLNRVTSKIVEVEDGKIYQYNGNYEYYIEMKSQRVELQNKVAWKNQRLFEKELKWIRAGAPARSTKQKARIDRFNDLKDNLESNSQSNLEISIPFTRLGTKVFEFKDVSFRYDSLLFSEFNHVIKPGDRLAILGKNGSGKTTILNMLASILESSSGELIKGETVKIGYFSQETDHFDEDQRVIDYIKDTSENVRTEDGFIISASQFLEQFLFDSYTSQSLIKTLSGGERRRLYLAKVLMDAPNVIILDEPTNDLDIGTLTILEEYLDRFKGVVIVTSHDRYFLEKVANTYLKIENKKIYQINTPDSIIVEETILDTKSVKKDSTNVKDKRENIKTKLSYNEKKELDEIVGIMEKLEEKISLIEIDMENNISDYSKLSELTMVKEEVEMELELKMERWVYLIELEKSFN
jgi:ATP-binding cassette subfamily F protein uup